MSKPIEYYVYELRLENKDLPFYVGKGIGARSRAHFSPSSLSDNTRKNNTIKKAGRDNIKIIVEYRAYDLTETDAFSLEKQLIKQYGRLDNDTGCLTNLTDGGEGHSGYIWSEEAKTKVSERMAGHKHPLFGKVGESAAFFGGKHTKEHIDKITGLGNPFFGKKHDEDSRLRMSEKTKGDKHPCFGSKPWETRIARNKPEILAIWSMAGEFYDWYLTYGSKRYGGSYTALSNYFNLQIGESSLKTCIKMFRKGWNPNEDKVWLNSFKENLYVQ